MKGAKLSKRTLLLVYVVLLLASHVVRYMASPSKPFSDQTTVQLAAQAGERILSRNITLAYSDFVLADVNDPPVLVLIHGNPVASRSMMALSEALPDSFRIIVPDLPGVGRSSRVIPDYSSRAQGFYLIQLLDTLDIERAHFVGYSLGSTVALEAYDSFPDRFRSLTMLSALGVQELELLGDYYLNHGIHALQLGFLWLIQEGVPHFGYLDDAYLNTSYARMFYDTDQRPLREILSRFEPPVLIQHGMDDFQVPYAAAEEHARIIPQSRLITYDGGHILLFSRPHELSDDISAFVNSVENGTSRTRSAADSSRVVAAEHPFDPYGVPVATGFALALMMVLIALATLVSEDLTCIGTGLLVTRGVIGFVPGTIACILGIYGGDILLYLLGRFVGKPFLRRAPLKWIIKEDSVRRGSKWIERQGPKVIFASRFVPGSRLPTYVSAGALGLSFWTFTAYMLLAAILWTPILVGFSAYISNELMVYFDLYIKYAFPGLIGLLLLMWLMVKLTVSLFTFKGRRMWVSRWHRITRWEFWPPWVFYLPLLVYIAYLAVRHRSLTVFTAANPTITDGGFVGESKSAILSGLSKAGNSLAGYTVLDPENDISVQFERIRAFMESEGMDYPVVLKPDVGERGREVKIVRSEEEIRAYFSVSRKRTIVQEYVPGREYGVFYYRYPGQRKGEIFSITEKRFPIVRGDGVKTIERLILEDKRAVCMASQYLEVNQDRVDKVPEEGEEVQLVEIGTHCLGAVFLDGNRVHTPALENALDRISQTFEGFYFGRYDIRTSSREDITSGKDFKIIELNGVTSEATHIYDPSNRLVDAYRVLRKQWKIAYEIGAINRNNGALITPARTLLRKTFGYKTPSFSP